MRPVVADKPSESHSELRRGDQRLGGAIFSIKPIYGDGRSFRSRRIIVGRRPTRMGRREFGA